MPAQHPTLEVLSLRSTRLYLVARFFSAFARSLVAATLSYHVYEATGSFAALGVLGLIEFFPVIPASLFGGVAADRFDRRRVLVVGQLAAAIGVGGLATASAGADLETLLLFAVAFLLSGISAVANPSNIALLPALVPARIFQNATVVSSNVRTGAWISGPLAMGFLVGPLGFSGPYALGALLYLGSVLCLLGVPATRGQGTQARRTALNLRSVGEGISFVWQRPAILGAMSLDMFAVIFASVNAMLPVYANEILEVGPQGYGVLRSGIAIGTFLMTFWLLIRTPFERPGRVLLGAVLVFGLATIVFGLSRSFPLSVGVLVLAGMADQLSMTTRAVILQLSTPDDLRGRVSSVHMIFVGASNELGDAESGFVAALTSATFSVVAGGVACLGVVAAVAARVPALRAWSISGAESERGTAT